MRKISLFIFFLVVPVSFIEAAISYIVTVQYNGTSASVHIPDEVSGVVRCISGTSSHVLLGQSSNTNNNQDEIIYALSGNTDDGEFSLSSTDNLTLNLKGLTLKNPRGEAIHVMGKRVKVSLAADTENMLSDGNGAVVEEGCFHCDGHTEFMGKGTLTVLSNMWCAIYSKEYLTLKNCTINVIGSMKDGVYCQEYFKMSSGVLKIDNVKDNGIKVEKRISNSNSQTNENSGNFYMTDGLLSIKNVGGDCIKTSGTITHSGGIFDFDTTNIKENSTETIIVPDFCIVNTGEVCAFFESPGNWTNTIHCWAWKDSPSENFTGGNWPGASCTLLGTAPNGNKVWKWIWDGKKQENSSAMQPAKIIFNNNGQPQTDDQTFTLGGYYNKYGLQGYAGESVVPSTPTDYSKQPFTIVAHNEDVTIRMVATTSEVFEDVKFSTDKGQTWTFFGNPDVFYRVIPANTSLSLRGFFLTYLYSFNISGGTFDVEGNVASLSAFYDDDWETETVVGGLKSLFSGHTNLVSAENLVLPATKLASNCYANMFSGCTSLTKAPALPATTLAYGCYTRMFEGCTSLATAPNLPATTLAMSCYEGMFRDCTLLTTAPQLPATTLKVDCYRDMFNGCTSLTTAPELLATTLDAESCYDQMFYGCTSLNYVKCLATEIETLYATRQWLYNVSSSGTFVKAASMNNDWSTGASGIPSGWTVINDGATSTDYSKQPFTIVPNGSQITVTLEAPNDGMVWESFNMYYSKDGGETWTQQLVPDWFWIDVNADEKLMIRTVKSGNFGHLSVSGGTFNLEGNIMSLQDAHGWETATTVYTSFCEHLHDLFSGNTNLISAENLILPATAFDGNSGAYANMFSGCTSLMKAPELPATTLAESCYFNMFKGCTSLTTAPVLPATTLAENCYDNMFNGCTSLNYMKCLATDISASNCTLNWLNGVSSTGTFVKSSSMNNWPSGSSGIPSGWTVESYKPSLKRTIHVATAGTLPNLISEDEKYEIEELTLTGELNGTDFKFIREMAGVNDYYEPVGPDYLLYHDRTNGKLISLDISKVNIVKGGGAYDYSCGGYNTNGSGFTPSSLLTSDNNISNRLFSRTLLESIILPDNVSSIADDAFRDCSSLTSITIPNSVTNIGKSAFSFCSSLTSIKVESGNDNYDSRNNCNAIIETSSNTLIAGCKNTIIPNSVTSIDSYAFYGCKGLTSVTIPNSVTSIGSNAFYNCSGLVSVTIPNSVTSIGSNAFYGCSSLTKVVSKIMEPFNIDSFTFLSDIYSNAELVIPAGTKSLYEATGSWNKFSKITEHLPTLETLPAQPTSTTKARLIALANGEDDDQHFGFEWLRNDAPANMPANKVSAPLYDGRIIGSLGGLNPDIYYKYRPFYKSDSGEMAYGEWIPFLTGDANVFFEPEVHTKEAIVSNDGALLSAVFVEGTEDFQEKGFEYWQKNSNARAVSLTRGDNIGSVIVSGNNTSVTIEGLKAGTEYGYRPYVKTASGITYGEEKTFKTLMLGDVNGDNKVDNYDLSDLVSYIMGGKPAHFNKDAADLNNDSQINAADIVKMVKILK